MEWTTNLPTVTGFYYVNVSSNPYHIMVLELCQDDYDDDDDPLLSWDDPNTDAGYDLNEFPDTARFKGPLPHPND